MLIVATVAYPVAMAKVLNTMALCRSMFITVGMIVIAIVIDVSMSLLVIIVRVASGVG
jgi:hypothetical protein